jgi:hypothetical protein
MLVHCRQGTAHVFPAVSEHWPDIKFENICLPGVFRISARRVKGKTVLVKIQSLKGGFVRLVVAGQEAMLLHQGGQTKEITCPMKINMSAGETITLSSAGGK